MRGRGEGNGCEKGLYRMETLHRFPSLAPLGQAVDRHPRHWVHAVDRHPGHRVQAVDRHPGHWVQARGHSLMIRSADLQVLKGYYSTLMRVKDRIHASPIFCCSPSETKDQLSFPV